jgi:hypothetical protein
MKKKYIIMILLIYPAIALPQYITTDTVYIDFIPDTLVPVNYVVSEVTDNRAVHPNLVSYARKKKFILVPVDQALLTHEKLAAIIMRGFQQPSAPLDTLLLGINYFIIDRYKGYFGSPYILKADIPVYKLSSTDTLPAGTLVYNYSYQPLRGKQKKVQVCEQLLNKWHTEFKMDLMITAGYLHNDNPAPENLVEKPLKRAHFLHANLGTTIGLNFWQVEGELYFTRPETGKQQWFLGNIVRYQHTPDFEMIGFGKKSEHFASRINDSWTLEIASNVLLGFLKWKETENIKLYQLLQFSLSSIQTVNYNKKNTSGLQLKAGLFENFYYVINMKPKLQAGIYLGAGYKF